MRHLHDGRNKTEVCLINTVHLAFHQPKKKSPLLNF